MRSVRAHQYSPAGLFIETYFTLFSPPRHVSVSGARKPLPPRDSAVPRGAMHRTHGYKYLKSLNFTSTFQPGQGFRHIGMIGFYWLLLAFVGFAPSRAMQFMHGLPPYPHVGRHAWRGNRASMPTKIGVFPAPETG